MSDDIIETASVLFMLAAVDYVGSGVFVGLLGVAYFADIHHIAYFVVVQIFVGVFEVSHFTYNPCAIVCSTVGY